MPELPEVETVCRGLQMQLPGEVIARVDVLRNDTIGYPQPDEFSGALAGHRFVAFKRRGKYILGDLDKGAGLVVHLRMSGKLLIKKAGARAGNFLRARFKLKSGRELHYEDMRVFGRLWYKPAGMTFEEVVPGLASLGVEPLEGLEIDLLKDLLANKKQPIKSALLDQRLIAGIGNIYADESLFRSGIHPQRPAGSLRDDELKRLLLEIPLVLQKAIKHGGSTLSDYVDTNGVNGRYQNKALVYGREGEPCRVCKSLVERVKLAGRSSHFCPQCQPLKKRGARTR
ncbi:MAG TPA: bifunctional DNA-formamidopyrimidine glycosylase/DNA-(apurinic or apyrimidinic site) lyase [Chroococcales cyanobacterium]